MDHRPRTLADRLPQFPWDRLAPYARKADAHPGGRVDLSVGTPVDPVPPVVRAALIEAADWPGYPVTRGTDALRAAALGWMERELGVVGDPGVLPVIGSKELVAHLPTLLGLGPGDRVGYPVPAYPTYEIGALLAGAEPVPTPFGELPDAASGPAPRLLWLNSPANPHGQVLDVAQLRALSAEAQGQLALDFQPRAERPPARVVSLSPKPAAAAAAPASADRAQAIQAANRALATK